MVFSSASVRLREVPIGSSGGSTAHRQAGGKVLIVRSGGVEVLAGFPGGNPIEVNSR